MAVINRNFEKFLLQITGKLEKICSKQVDLPIIEFSITVLCVSKLPFHEK